MGVRESTGVLIRKLQLCRSRNRCVGVLTSYTLRTATFQISRNVCLRLPEVKRAEKVTYKTQFSILWYVDVQSLTISRGEVFVIPFGRKRWHDVTENVSRDLIPNNDLQSIKFEFITSRKQGTKAKITAINHYSATSGSWTLTGTSELQNALLNAWTKFEPSSWRQFRSFAIFSHLGLAGQTSNFSWDEPNLVS